MNCTPPRETSTIGVWDSGIGGLSVLQALRIHLPGVRLHYLADSAYAPYGDRSAAEVTARSLLVTRYLIEAGAAMIVVACNTATTAAIQALRAQWPKVPIVGVEPGIKPAAERSRSRRIGVLATRGTINSQRLRSLVEQHARECQVVLQACPGLVDAIEAGEAQATQLDDLLQRYCAPLRHANVDTVVLGCTHYVFVADRIRSIMGPDVAVLDTADAVARRATSLWKEPFGTESPAHAPKIDTTGDREALTQFARRWIDPAASAKQVSLDMWASKRSAVAGAQDGT